MEIRVEQGDITQVRTKALVVNLFEGVQVPGGATGAVDRALDGAISQLIREGELKGKAGEFALIHTFGRMPATRVIVAGLGKREEFALDKVRALAGNVARYLRRLRIDEYVTITHGAGVAGLDPEACAQAIAEGTVLGLYEFTRHKRPEDDRTEVRTVVIMEASADKVEALRRGVARGVVLAEAANFARDLVNEPANQLPPAELARRAQEMAEREGLEVQVYDRAWAEAKGMGAFLSVSNGSVQPPKFIVIRYSGGDERGPHLALVGKGITFDSGGISIKPAEGMEAMKGDMAGGAACIAAMYALARLKPPLTVTAIVPATENMPSGSATKPGDVVRAMNGKTIEVVNTDAEGRIILADGLAYACEIGATHLIDVATLTGAKIVALGNIASALMTNNQELCDRVLKASDASGEKMWQLPMWDEYKEQIKSEVADMKNTGGRPAGSITAAKLLQEFVDNRPWVHIDIAGTELTDKEQGWQVKGATGVPVRTLVNLALDLAALSHGPAAQVAVGSRG